MLLLLARIGHCCWLLLKAKHPITGIIYYFIDKCMPFGASISCAQFQKFSDSMKHLACWRITWILLVEPSITNYLDDFLFAAITMMLCNCMVQIFLVLCQEISCPIADNKTEWATQYIVFLGILLNGKVLFLSVPEDKRHKALNMLSEFTTQYKTMIKKIQKLMGTLNFINCAG